MEERFASYFKEMEWAIQRTFEGGHIKGGQPHEEVYMAVTRTFFTKERYVSSLIRRVSVFGMSTSFAS